MPTRHPIPRFRALLAVSLGACVAVGPPGCASTRIAAMEKLGYAKREQLVSRVKDARESQDKAKVQFESALAEFLAVTGAKGGDLETKYNQLKKEYDRSESRAGTVRDRIKAVDQVAQALFSEWQTELKQYSSEGLRRSSERQLDDTRRQYDRLLGAMRAAESKMDPVLAAFKDQVLFLKHNLNARAIASLQDNVSQVQSDVERLVREMEASIAEADAFIEQMNTDQN